MSNALETLRAILLEKLPDEQVQALMSELTIAVGNGSVAISGSAAESVILTGSNNQVIRNGFGVEEIRAIVQELQSHQTQSRPTDARPPDQTFENEPLVLIIEPAMVELINSRLAVIEELQKSGQLSSPQQVEFNSLRGKIYSFKEINQELELLANSFDRILKEAVISLTTKLRELDNSRGESLLEARSQVCLREQIELLTQFQTQLGDGKTVAYWLNRRRSQHLAQELGKRALDTHPKIKETVSSRRIEAFYFSIGQFLDQLSHCLTWGRANSLTNSGTPVVLDDKVYVTAFEYLKSLIPEHLPDAGIEQLKEYVDYLVKNLPNYRHLSID